MNRNRERSIFLSIVCLIGLGVCFFAYKHGPISFASQQNAAPPGWVPPANQQQPQQPQQQVQPQQQQVQPQQPQHQQPFNPHHQQPHQNNNC